ncbi:MAG: YbaB/EbfC family nucleoid-associated protein, partial [Phycisphaerales bacterium]|nr:YbaB/EbfC family nucleoid-associated protein [Phycisphaerales bacterium]
MLDNLKALGALSGLMKNKDKIAESARRVRDELASARITGQSGGGVVRAVASGDMRVVSIEISAALGAGLGAYKDDENRLRGAALYAVPGAAIGAIGGSISAELAA